MRRDIKLGRYFGNGSKGVASFISHQALSTRSFRICDGRNDSTRRGVMTASTPVFGLRPTRWRFDCTENVPKDDSLTSSPASRQAQISSRTDSTRSDDSFLDSPMLR